MRTWSVVENRVFKKAFSVSGSIWNKFIYKTSVWNPRTDMECLALCQTEVKFSSRSTLLFERYVWALAIFCMKFLKLCRVCVCVLCRGQNALCQAEHLTVNVTWEIQLTPTQTSFPHSREPTTYSLILVKKTKDKIELVPEKTHYFIGISTH